MPDPFAKPSKTKRFFKALKKIFLTKLYMNLLILLVIIILSLVGFEYIKPDKTETPTGNVILEQECPECVCEEAQEGCEPDCDLCPVKTKVETKNIIYYSCPGGALVKNLDECENYLPNISKEYSATFRGTEIYGKYEYEYNVVLDIDNIEYEKEEDDFGCVTRVDYTIINKGEFPIVPKMQVKVYEDWGKDWKTAPGKEIDSRFIVNPHDYIKRQDRLRVCFQGEEPTLRLSLSDTLPDPDTDYLVAATRDFDLDYAD